MGEYYYAQVRFGPCDEVVAGRVAEREGVVVHDDPICERGVARGEDGMWTLVDSQANYGIYAFREHGVLDELRELGVAYCASDEGHYDIPGQVEDWAPGMDDVRLRPNLSDAGPAVTQAEWERIKEQARGSGFGPTLQPAYIVDLLEEFFTERVG